VEFFDPHLRVDFLRVSRPAAIISIVAVLLSWTLVFTKGLNFGIDFAGGTEALLSFNGTVPTGQIREQLAKTGLEKPEVVTYGLRDEGRYFVRSQTQSLVTPQQQQQIKQVVEQKAGATKLWDTADETGEEIRVQFDGTKDQAALDGVAAAIGEAGFPGAQIALQSGGATPTYAIHLPGVRQKLNDAMKAAFADKFKGMDRLESVGSAVGKEMRDQGALAVLYAVLGIVLYIALRFDLRYAPGGAIALIHDVSVTVGIYSLLGLEFNLPIVAALLSIVGYSINDTVVVYDRIRENVQRGIGRDLADTINISVSETLSRTINTSMTTFLSVLAIYVFCAGTVQNFAFAMMVGTIVGTYSSIYVANPIVLWMDRYLAKSGGSSGERRGARTRSREATPARAGRS
jgi:preprotein translocase subunit SecF